MVLRLHLAAAVIFVVAILVQVFFAGAAISNLGGSGDFKTHIEFGYTWVGLASLAVLVSAILGACAPAAIQSTSSTSPVPLASALGEPPAPESELGRP